MCHHYSDVKCLPWRLELLLNGEFAQPFVHTVNKETSKVRVTVPLWVKPPVTGGFPAQKDSNSKNISIWWCHNDWTIPAPFYSYSMDSELLVAVSSASLLIIWQQAIIQCDAVMTRSIFSQIFTKLTP